LREREQMAKIKIDGKLYDRAKKAAETAGYSSFEEFITYIIEKELSQLEGSSEGDDAVADQLRGLGYIE
jgi:hypothetical protein